MDSKPKDRTTKAKEGGTKKNVALETVSYYPKLRTQKFQNAFYKMSGLEREDSVWTS